MTWLGALTLLFALLVPDVAAAAVARWLGGSSEVGSSVAADGRTARSFRLGHDFDGDGDVDGGACGEDDDDPVELIDCGSDLDAHFDEPLAITVLRETEVRTTRAQCDALLADIWSRQACSALSRECGKLLPGAVPSPGPKLASGSGSGMSSLLALIVAPAASRGLGPWAEPQALASRDLLPPVPPPKLGSR